MLNFLAKSYTVASSIKMFQMNFLNGGVVYVETLLYEVQLLVLHKLKLKH